MNKSEEAIAIFHDRFNCSQAVLAVFCEKYGLNRETALKMATGFGAGARKGELCGAVSGAIMVLGLHDGHAISGDMETKMRAYQLVERFEQEFIARNGSLVCRDLLKYDVSVPGDLEVIMEKDLFKTVCPGMVSSAVDILEEMLA